MNTKDKIEQNKAIAGFRYSLIAELTNQNLSPPEINQLIREKAGRSYHIPYSTKTSVTEKSIKNWLLAFQIRGIDGITPKLRRDIGKSKCLTQAEQDALINCLEKQPYLTAKAAFLLCQKAGTIKNSISASSLSRLVRAHGLDKKNRMQSKQQAPSLKFNFRYPLECVQSDFMHAFPIPDHTGKKRTAKLLTIMDDATRRILYACFTFSEKAEEFEKGLRYVLSTHGRINKVYVDNGASFISTQTKRILTVLGIPIIHSTAYRPQGRGKQERFYRTVREQFLRPLDQATITSLEQLNILFNSWVEYEYHRNPHSGLNNETPLDTWLKNIKHIIPIDPSIDLEQVFMHQAKRKIYNDSTFSFQGTLYEVPSNLIGKTVEIWHDAQRAGRPVLVFLDGQFIAEARILDSYANTKVNRNSQANAPKTKNQEFDEAPGSTNTAVMHIMSAAKIDL